MLGYRDNGSAARYWIVRGETRRTIGAYIQLCASAFSCYQALHSRNSARQCCCHHQLHTGIDVLLQFRSLC